MTSIPTHQGPLDRYRAGDRVDELVDSTGAVRAHWADLAATYELLGSDELDRRHAEIRSLLEQDGVTYNTPTDDRRTHRPWLLDPVPLVIAEAEWAVIERGVQQRAELLNLILRDIYGARTLLRGGLLPPAMILADPQFERAADGITLPGGRQLIISAFDLARDRSGEWVAYGHRTQAPSGAAFALENRRVLSRVFPALFQRTSVSRLAPFVRALRAALRNAAPPGVDDPSVVVLSPGPISETAFEHASISAQLGYPLVQGADLVVEDGKVWLRTVSRLMPVDVILRRVDSSFCDPLEFRANSTLGVPGLTEVCRTGAVSVVNTLGSGVLENAGLAAALPDVCRHLLGEDLALPSPPTWWCGDAGGRSHVLAHLDDLFVRPLSRATGEHSHDTRLLSAAERDDLRRRIKARPEAWVGQERIEPATAPLLGATGIEARPTVHRSFAVATESGYLVMAGGLARSAGPHPSAPITNRAGAIAKDVWVLATEPEPSTDFWLSPADRAGVATSTAPAARAAEHLFWLGRYAERAEATVRLLRAVHGRRDEFQNASGGPGPATLSALLEATTRITGTFPGFVGDDAKRLHADPTVELRSLLVDEQRAGSVAQAVGAMFEAIDVVRDQLSVDTWLVVGSLERELERLHQPEVTSDDDDAVTNVLDELLQGLLALWGLIAESMVRDQSWQFLEAGRRIERALQVSALVGNTLNVERSPAVESLVLESVLTAGESIITYRRRYRSRAAVSTALDLLLADARNPRSLRFQIDALSTAVAELHADHPKQSEASAVPLVTGLARTTSQLDTVALGRPGEKGRRGALDELTFAVRDTLFRASDALAADFFVRRLPQVSVVTPIESPRRQP